MRVTNEMMVGNSLRRLSTRLNAYERAQARLATGKQNQVPSDDPSAANRGLSLRATQRTRQQEARNAADAMSWLDATDSKLQAAVERVQRARELTLQGMNSGGDGQRAAIADEMRTIQQELVAIANSRIRGLALFSGYSNDDAVTRVGTAWAVIDTDEAINRRVGDQDLVQVNVTAAQVFGPVDGDNVFAVLDTLIDDLDSGNTAGLSDALNGLDAANARLGSGLAQTGSNTNWIESALARSKNDLFQIQGELAQVEDADYAEAVMDLQVQDMAFQSTLQALSRALPPSLASFLR